MGLDRLKLHGHVTVSTAALRQSVVSGICLQSWQLVDAIHVEPHALYSHLVRQGAIHSRQG
jgi:hypothetical protein